MKPDEIVSTASKISRRDIAAEMVKRRDEVKEICRLLGWDYDAKIAVRIAFLREVMQKSGRNEINAAIAVSESVIDMHAKAGTKANVDVSMWIAAAVDLMEMS